MKGHLPADTHIHMLRQVTALLPLDTPVTFLDDGDGYVDSVDLQQALDACGWADVCQTAQNTPVEVAGTWRRLGDIDGQLGRRGRCGGRCASQPAHRARADGKPRIGCPCTQSRCRGIQMARPAGAVHCIATLGNASSSIQIVTEYHWTRLWLYSRQWRTR